MGWIHSIIWFWYKILYFILFHYETFCFVKMILKETITKAFVAFLIKVMQLCMIKNETMYESAWIVIRALYTICLLGTILIRTFIVLQSSSKTSNLIWQHHQLLTIAWNVVMLILQRTLKSLRNSKYIQFLMTLDYSRSSLFLLYILLLLYKIIEWHRKNLKIVNYIHSYYFMKCISNIFTITFGSDGQALAEQENLLLKTYVSNNLKAKVVPWNFEMKDILDLFKFSIGTSSCVGILFQCRVHYCSN